MSGRRRIEVESGSTDVAVRHLVSRSWYERFALTMSGRCGITRGLRFRQWMRTSVPIVAVLLLLALAACGGDDDGTDTTPTPAATPGGQTTNATTPPGSGGPAAQRVIDLATEAPLTTIWGADTGDFNNDLPLLTTGDFNGDGTADLLIGARFGDGPDDARQDSGEAYIIYGRSPLPESIDIAAGEFDAVIYGAKANDQLGFSGAAGDVTGDGIDDVIIGAPFALRDDGGAAGKAYVLPGGTLAGVIDLAARDAATTLVGAGGQDYFGDAAATTDANGDGTADIIIGATFARRAADLPNAGAQAGAAYLFLGGPDLPTQLDVAAGDFDLAVYGENDDPHPDELGDNVFGADLNGDGFGDIIATAEAADGPDNRASVAAEVHVVFGRDDISGVVDVGAGQQDVSVWGAEENDTFGFNLGAGDVNGDGVDDLLGTARGADGAGNIAGESGEVQIILGRPNITDVDLLNDESDAMIHGDDPADMLAYGLVAIDIDGDGTDELIAGSSFGDGPGNSRGESGEVFVIDARNLSGDYAVSAVPVLLAIYGGSVDDGLGQALTAGDLDGDGAAEIVILALRTDSLDDARPDAGEIYILR